MEFNTLHDSLTGRALAVRTDIGHTSTQQDRLWQAHQAKFDSITQRPSYRGNANDLWPEAERPNRSASEATV